MNGEKTLLAIQCRTCESQNKVPVAWVNLDNFTVACSGCGSMVKLDAAGEERLMKSLHDAAQKTAARAREAMRALNEALGPHQDK